MNEFPFHPVCLAFLEMGQDAYERRLNDYRRHPEQAGATAVWLAQSRFRMGPQVCQTASGNK